MGGFDATALGLDFTCAVSFFALLLSLGVSSGSCDESGEEMDVFFSRVRLPFFAAGFWSIGALAAA